MSRLHLFCPENDLALARDIERYTPPPAASRLKMAGECLPLWYGDAGDSFVCYGVNAQWLDNVCGTFGIDMQPYDFNPAGLTPAPWGWSRAVRADFRSLGFDREALPTDAVLDDIRRLSHRRTAATITRRLLEAGIPSLAPPAALISSEAELEQALGSGGELMFKAPWSSSGRGLIPVSPREAQAKRPQLIGIIRRQGSVMAEPRHPRGTDFALLYNMENGKALFRGLSLFATDANGVYTANILAPQEQLRLQIASACTKEIFEALVPALQSALEAEIASAYQGPLGVDFMAIDSRWRLALCEVNLRRTMGHVCLDLYDRYVEPGRLGRFEITPRTDATPELRAVRPEVFDGHLRRGTLFLNPPGSDFDFKATVR